MDYNAFEILGLPSTATRDEVQDKYNNIQREHTHNDMMQFTGKQREEANFKALIV